MSKRREGRTAALQALYGLDIRGGLGGHGRGGVPAADAEAALARAGEVTAALAEQIACFGSDLDLEMREFAAGLCEGVVAQRERIDGLLERCSHNWRLERMSYIDRNVLRLAAFELAERPDVPAGVVINEAIEIGKAFGSTDSGAFINGVLDRVARELGR